MAILIDVPTPFGWMIPSQSIYSDLGVTRNETILDNYRLWAEDDIVCLQAGGPITSSIVDWLIVMAKDITARHSHYYILGICVVPVPSHRPSADGSPSSALHIRRVRSHFSRQPHDPGRKCAAVRRAEPAQQTQTAVSAVCDRGRSARVAAQPTLTRRPLREETAPAGAACGAYHFDRARCSAAAIMTKKSRMSAGAAVDDLVKWVRFLCWHSATWTTQRTGTNTNRNQHGIRLQMLPSKEEPVSVKEPLFLRVRRRMHQAALWGLA